MKRVSALRRIEGLVIPVALGVIGLLGYSAVQTWSHTSEQPVILGRYAPDYFVVVLLSHLLTVVLAGLLVGYVICRIRGCLYDVENWLMARFLGHAGVRWGIIVVWLGTLVGLSLLTSRTFLTLALHGALASTITLLSVCLLWIVAFHTHAAARQVPDAGPTLGDYLRNGVTPLLVGLYAVLYLYQTNQGQLGFSEILRGLVVAILLVVFLYISFALIWRDPSRAALFTASALLGFFATGHIVQFLLTADWLPASLQNASVVYSMILSGVVSTTLLLAARLASRRDAAETLSKLSTIFMSVAGMMVVFLLIQIWSFERANRAQAETVSVNAGPTGYGGSSVSAENPDIYYIILDAYSAKGVLAERFGFDNTEFYEALRQRGFYVAEDSHTNYCKTFLSLPSSLNMQYLDEMIASFDENTTDETLMEPAVLDNEVWHVLEPMGYRYVHVASRISLTDDNPYADVVLNTQKTSAAESLGSLNDFELLLGRTTALYPFFDETKRPRRTELLRRSFDQVATVPTIEGPTFTFAHILLPHRPFIFKADEADANPGGSPVDGQIVDQALYEAHRDAVEQYIYVNRRVIQMVDQILATSETRPIIILQADHGSWEAFPGFEGGPEAVRHYLLPIFNAYYVPESVFADLYDSISPVNSFRLLFRDYFGLDMELLEDRSYCIPSQSQPYGLYEVELP